MIRSLKNFPNALINYNRTFHTHIGCRDFDESCKKYTYVHLHMYVHAYIKERIWFCLLYHSHRSNPHNEEKSCAK